MTLEGSVRWRSTAHPNGTEKETLPRFMTGLLLDAVSSCGQTVRVEQGEVKLVDSLLWLEKTV